MKKASIFRFVLASFVACLPMLAAQAFVQQAEGDVTLTGRVTCSQCEMLALHKGFTPWSWAMYRVSQGDDIVLVTLKKTYALQGNREQLTKYIEDKAIVSGYLDNNTIKVAKIGHPTKEK